MSKLTLVFPLAAAAFLLLLFSEYLPLLRGPLPTQPRNAGRWTRRDSLAAAVITVVYAVTAFVGLGSTQGVQSWCKFRSRGEYALIELQEETEISSVRYFAGLHTGNYYMQFSSDGEEYTDVSVMPQDYTRLFKWQTAELNGACSRAKYIRIIADSTLWMGELVICDGSGAQISARDMSYAPGCDPLFDEQELAAETDGFMHNTYFDEIYHARTALEHIENVVPYEISHPPLGKLILSVGIRLFGMVPFGWRFMGTLFGVLMLPALYVFLKRMFGGTAVPACCTAVFAFDFMHFVQTRIATIDTYAVFFIILMYLFMWRYYSSPYRDRKHRSEWLPPLALSGICFGLGAACKWTCLYAGAGLGVLWLIDRISRAFAAKDKSARNRYLDETEEIILWCLLFFVLVPAVIYYVSYWRYGTAQGLHGPGMLFSREYFHIVVDNQTYMFNYHSGVTATHPYSSVWWQWLLDVRPILYYLEHFEDGTRASFGAWVNPLLCWGGLLAMLCMVWLAAVKRDKAALFILVGYLAQLLPWVFVKRVIFEYHYFPSTVFLVLALGHVFRTIELRQKHWKRLLFSFTGACIVLFAVFYPALAGRPISAQYGQNFLHWMNTWPF